MKERQRIARLDAQPNSLVLLAEQVELVDAQACLGALPLAQDS